MNLILKNEPLTHWEKEYSLLLQSIIHGLERKFQKHRKLKLLLDEKICHQDRLKIKRALMENQKTIESIQFNVRKNRSAIRHFFGMDEYNRISKMNHVNAPEEIATP